MLASSHRGDTVEAGRGSYPCRINDIRTAMIMGTGADPHSGCQRVATGGIMTHPHHRLVNAMLIALLALDVSGARPAAAAQFDVTTAADAGPGSLRQALLDAAAAAGPDDVVVQAGLGTITLTSELGWGGVGGPNAVTIQGNGVHLDFAGASRGLVDGGGKGVTISDMTITGVGGTIANDAAPVLSEGGAVSLDHCTITGNTVTNTSGDAAGGVLSEGGSVTIHNCTITGNTVNATGDGAGGVLAEGGSLDASNSTIGSNTVHAGGDAGGGLDSEGGEVTMAAVSVDCNHASSDGGDVAGGLLSEGGAVTVDGSTIAGNSATTTAGGLSNNQLLSNGLTPMLTSTTITDDTSACSEAIAAFVLPKRIALKLNAGAPAKSHLAAAGFFDTGPGVVDLTAGATLDVGGLHVDVPSLTHKGAAFVLQAGGTTFKIVPNRSGSSRAKFLLKTVSDFTGQIDADGPLALHFHDATVDGGGTVSLAGGKYALGKVRGALVAPNLYPVSARAALHGGGKDTLALKVGLATAGTTPAQASDVSIAFGPTLSVTIPAASFVKQGDKYEFTGNVGGVTRVVLDYARETIKITGKGLDLGTFAQGGNSVAIAISVGSDARAVQVRMARKGVALRY